MSTCDEAASTVLYAGSTCKEERTQGKQKTDAAEAVNSASKPIRLGLLLPSYVRFLPKAARPTVTPRLVI